jgi:hypothetical protein
MQTARFTAAASLYTSTIPYRQGVQVYPGSQIYELTHCDVYYDVCTLAANDNYTYCLVGCFARGLGEACQTGCQSPFDDYLSQCRQQYLCRGKGTQCQFDVQNPLGAPPKCCPIGYLNCAGTCVPDCPDKMRIDPPTCTCQCIPVICPPPKMQDPVTCDCVCPPCDGINFSQDPSTCACYCPTEVINGVCCQSGESKCESTQGPDSTCCAPAKCCSDDIKLCCGDTEHCSAAQTPEWAKGWKKCCPEGSEACVGIGIGCCPPAKCCPGAASNPCCSDTKHCSTEQRTGEVHCCPAGTEWFTAGPQPVGGALHGMCCPTGQIFVYDPAGIGCCDVRKACNGNTRCCPDLVSADHPPEGQHCSGGSHCCPLGTEWSGGGCCPPGQVWCSDKCCDSAACCGGVVCANLQNDPAHCGNCFVSCVGGQTCRNGQCICPDGRLSCGGVCCPAGLICWNGQCGCSPGFVNVGGSCVVPSVCGVKTVSGQNMVDTRVFELGRSSARFIFVYNTLIVPDRIVVTYEGRTLFDNVCTATIYSTDPWDNTQWCPVNAGPSGDIFIELSYSGTSTQVTVTVTPNCAGTADTEWGYTVGCPE